VYSVTPGSDIGLLTFFPVCGVVYLCINYM
jgi:hypothetical protein